MMKWKENMQIKLDDMIRENEWMNLHAQRIIHLMPPTFIPALKKLNKELTRLAKCIANQPINFIPAPSPLLNPT